MYYFRNKLNARKVKGKVRNCYRAHKYLYHTVLDALCCVMFLDEFEIVNFDDVIPENFGVKPDDEKIAWINEICTNLLKKHFFNEGDDLMETLREILIDPNHPENYWISNMNDGRVQCHFCERSYAYVGSLKKHEETKTQCKGPKTKNLKRK